MIYVPNKKVACTPLGQYRAIQLKGNSFKTAEQKGALLDLRVVYGNERFAVGDRVWIRGDSMTLGWTREEFVGPDNQAFILVPEDYIQLQEKQ